MNNRLGQQGTESAPKDRHGVCPADFHKAQGTALQQRVKAMEEFLAQGRIVKCFGHGIGYLSGGMPLRFDTVFWWKRPWESLAEKH